MPIESEKHYHEWSDDAYSLRGTGSDVQETGRCFAEPHLINRGIGVILTSEATADLSGMEDLGF